jgi:hypothetical protein
MNMVCQCKHLNQLESQQHNFETIKTSTLTVSEAAKNLGTLMKCMKLREMKQCTKHICRFRLEEILDNK